MEFLTGDKDASVEISLLPQIISWKESLEYLSPDKVCFEKYLFIASSKVLFGGKPGELLLLREDASFGCELNCLLERAKSLAWTWGIWLQVLGIVPLGARIVIYDRDRVNRVLKKSKNTALLINSGYSRISLAEDFFAEIGKRWEQSGEIPHEIGVALGYPVKDVVGFLGLVPLQYLGNYGWRVYGTEEPSIQLRDKYDQAKKAALKFLEESIGETNDASGKLLN